MLRLLLTKKYDFIHAHEESVFFVTLFKPLFKYKMIYDMHSSLPQQLTNFKFTTSKFIISIFKSMEDVSLRSADAVITICPDLYNYVNTVIDDKEKHYLIENSIFDKVKLINKENSKVETTANTDGRINIPIGKKLMVYAGTLEKYQGIDILIKSFSHVLKKVPDALLLIVRGYRGSG